MAAGNARYFRYLLFAFFGLTVIYFVTSSSSQRLPTREEILRGGKQWAQKTTPLEEDMFDNANDEVKMPKGKPKVKPSQSEDDEMSAPLRKKPAHKVESHEDDDEIDAPARVSSNSKSSLPPPVAPGARMNATFVSLARNSDLWEIARSIRQVEDRFNRKYGYDWVFLNDKPFDDEFKKVTTALISGKTHYGLIDEKHWSFPSHIDQDKAKKVREDMAQKKIIYGDSISYRHMCRFESGFFFQQPLMKNYEWYWRVEPSVELFCDINYDPFKYMADHKKKYSFVLSLYEYVETIETLWDSTLKFMKNYPEHIAEDNSMAFLSDDGGKTYNHCHMWSNFEIGNLDWLRGKAYTDFFESLDQDGGFFYERWGDAPVHSIAAGILLNKEEVHFFNDIAYYHVPFTHCPTGEKTRLELKCHCDPKNNFDWKGYSCTSRYFELNKLPKPEGWESEKD